MEELKKELELLRKDLDCQSARITRLEKDLAQERQMRAPYQPFRPLQASSGCSVCGLKMDTSMGYVCDNPRCPTRITY
jgi:hypothetical protein